MSEHLSQKNRLNTLSESRLQSLQVLLKNKGLLAENFSFINLEPELESALSLYPVHHETYDDFLGDVMDLIEKNKLDLTGPFGQQQLASVIRHLARHEWYVPYEDLALSSRMGAARVRQRMEALRGAYAQMKPFETEVQAQSANENHDGKAA